MRIKTYKLSVNGAPMPFIIDRKYAKIIGRHSWGFVKRLTAAKATIRKGVRIFLHHYIAQLEGKRWKEIYFDSQNRFDCRFANLQPYDRSEHGSKRRPFKNRKGKLKGVYLIMVPGPNGQRVHNGKFKSVIRFRKTEKFLGTFPTADLAARAYKREYDKLHPK